MRDWSTLDQTIALRIFGNQTQGRGTLRYMTGPLPAFDGLEIEEAFALLAGHNYAGAQEKLGSSKEGLPDPSSRDGRL